MYTVLVIVQVLVSVALIGLILLQHGKGADAGAAFGSGASGTVFGSRGSANFLSRATGWLATVFFAVSLAIAYLVHDARDPSSVVDRAQARSESAAPTVRVEVPPTAVSGEQPAAATPEQAPVEAPVVPE